MARLHESDVNYLLKFYRYKPHHIHKIVDSLLELHPYLSAADVERELKEVYGFCRTSATFPKPLKSKFGEGVVESILDSYVRNPFYFEHIVYDLQQLYPHVSAADIEKELKELHDFFVTSDTFTKPIRLKLDKGVVPEVWRAYDSHPYYFPYVVDELERLYPNVSEDDIEKEDWHQFSTNFRDLCFTKKYEKKMINCRRCNAKKD